MTVRTLELELELDLELELHPPPAQKKKSSRPRTRTRTSPPPHPLRSRRTMPVQTGIEQFEPPRVNSNPRTRTRTPPPPLGHLLRQFELESNSSNPPGAQSVPKTCPSSSAAKESAVVRVH